MLLVVTLVVVARRWTAKHFASWLSQEERNSPACGMLIGLQPALLSVLGVDYG